MGVSERVTRFIFIEKKMQFEVLDPIPPLTPLNCPLCTVGVYGGNRKNPDFSIFWAKMVKKYVGHMALTGFLPNVVENRRNGHFKSEKRAKNNQKGQKWVFWTSRYE